MTAVGRQRAWYVISDYIAGVLAMFCFNLFRFYYLPLASLTFPSAESFILSGKISFEIFAMPLICLGVYWLSGYYNQPFNKSRLQEFFTTLGTALLVTALFSLLLLTNDMVMERSINVLMLTVMLGCFFIFTYTGRLLITLHGLRLTRARSVSFNTVIIGASAAARSAAERFSKSRATLGFRVEGFVPVEGEETDPSLSPLVDKRDLQDFCDEHGVTQIVVALDAHNDQKVLEILNDLLYLGRPIKIAPDTLSFLTSSIRLKDIYGEPLVDLTSPTFSESAKNIKRTLDVALSIFALLLLAVPMAVIAVAVKMDSRGPVIYRQERIGYRRRPFRILKFRSMRTDAESEGPSLSSDNDPRVTRLGRVMRKYRLDELPQFWNVVKGDMSLVGPRPEREYFIRQILKVAPWYVLVHQVRPGITSWGMVKFGYATSVKQMADRARFDLVYLANMSTAVDFKIMIYTIKTIVSGKGK